MDKDLSTVLEQEHHEIDASIEAFLEGLSLGETRIQELTRAVDALREHILPMRGSSSSHRAEPRDDP